MQTNWNFLNVLFSHETNVMFSMHVMTRSRESGTFTIRQCASWVLLLKNHASTDYRYGIRFRLHTIPQSHFHCQSCSSQNPLYHLLLPTVPSSVCTKTCFNVIRATLLKHVQIQTTSRQVLRTPQRWADTCWGSVSAVVLGEEGWSPGNETSLPVDTSPSTLQEAEGTAPSSHRWSCTHEDASLYPAIWKSWVSSDFKYC